MTGFADVADPMAFINLRYTSYPQSKYVENELMDATIMLLADKTIVPNGVVPTTANQLLKAVKQSIRASVLDTIPDTISVDIKIKNKLYDRLFKAPKLTKATTKPAIVTLDQSPMYGEHGCRYKGGEEDMAEKEINKFLTACQVLSSTECLNEPVYRTPVIKAHAKSFFIRTQYWKSKSVPGRLYISVPKFVEDVCAKYAPTSLCTLTLAQIEEDKVQKIQAPDAW